MFFQIASVLLRRWKLALSLFIGIELGIGIYIANLPLQYTANIKLLLNRGRIDSLVSSEEEVKPRLPVGVTTEEVNTELELLRSRDLLRNVVLACGLHEKKAEPGMWDDLRSKLGISEERKASNGKDRVPRAVARLSGQLQMTPLRESNLIELTYTSTNAETSARVLNTLANLYLDKHMEVHRPSGTFEFFQREAEQSERQLQQLENQIAALGASAEGASPQLAKEAILRKISDFEADLKQTRAEIAVSEQRISTLEQYASATPSRAVAEVRTSSRIPDHLQSTLLDLELKRTELSKVFQPGHPKLQLVENQIKQARTAIEAFDQRTSVDEVMQRDPTHEWVHSELMKERAKLAGLKAQVASTRRTIADYRKRVQEVTKLELVNQDLKRQADLAEDHYMLYLRKQEDARISNELDRHRILNVIIVESADIPYSPSGPRRKLLALLGSIFGLGLSLGLTFLLDRVEPWVRARQRKPLVHQLVRPAN